MTSNQLSGGFLSYLGCKPVQGCQRVKFKGKGFSVCVIPFHKDLRILDGPW